MNAPARKILEGEILAPGDGLVTVIGETHPFHGGRVAFTVPAVNTIEELLELGFPARGRRPVAAYLVNAAGELAIPEELWRRVRPKPGTVLAFKARLAGGSFRSIALIAVSVAALIIAPYLAPAALSILGITATSTALAVASGLIATGITLAGSLAVNSLFPVRPPTLANQIAQGSVGSDLLRKTVYSIQGARNQARPYSPFPALFGRRRIWPPLLAKTFTELVGDDEYLRIYLCVGIGPIAISDLRIGETPIASFSDCEVEIREGFADDDPITLYPARDPQQEVLSIRLVQTETSIRTTALETDEISVDVTAINGIYRWNSENGSPEAYGVTVNAYHRLVGAVDWFHFGQVNFTLETSTARRNMRAVVARGQYEVWVHKAQSDANSTQIRDEIYWTALRSFVAETLVNTPMPLARIAIRIRATGQANGIVDQVNCIGESVQLCFNGSSWELGISSNPADLYRLGLQHPANKRAAVDADLPLENLEAFWQYCDANDFRFDFLYEDKTSVSDMLADIAAAGRGASVFVDGKRGVAWDSFDAQIVQHITPRNSSGFQGQRQYRHFPHAWRIPFVNELKGYSADERIVYADGFDETTATLFESREFPGITHPDLIFRHARYQDAQDRLRPERYSVVMSWDQLRCTFNDLVRLTHHVPLLGQVSARVTAVAGQVITLDEVVTMESDAVYAVRFRLGNGDSLLRDVVLNVGEQTTIELDGAGDVPEVGDLTMFGEAGEESIECRVYSIQHKDKFSARITLVDNAPEIADADLGLIPEFNSHISDPIDFYLLEPQDLRVVELVDGSGGAKTPVVRLSWRVPRQGRVASFEAEARDDTAAGGEYTLRKTVPWPQTQAEFREILLGPWSFRVRAVFSDGNFSRWSILAAEQITGTHLSSPLPDVTDLHAIYRDNVLNLDWQEIVDFRPIAYEIRKGDDFPSSLFLQTVAHPPFPTMGVGTYFVQAVSQPVAGLTVYSETPADILIVGAVLTKNVVAEFDHAALGWPGIFGGTAAISGALIRTGGAGNILSVSDFLAESDILNFGGGGDGTYETPTAHTFDMGRAVDVGIAIDLNAAGSRVDDNILDDPDFLANPDILDSAASRFVDVWAEISVAVNDDPMNWIWSPWERWSSGRKTARAVKARLVLMTNDPNVFALVTTFIVRIDCPDRLDHYEYETDAGGDTITFTPDLAVDAAPFNGGPNGSPVPAVTGVIVEPQNGDRLLFTALSASAVTVQAVNAAGAGQVRDVLILAQGF